MKPVDLNADLRRQLDEVRKARRAGLARLKDVAQKATAGRETPITDKFNHEELNAPPDSDSDLPAVARIKNCRMKAKQSREARSAGVRAFKKTSMAVAQIMRRTILDSEDGNNGAEPVGQT